MQLLRRIRPRSGLNLLAILLGIAFIDCTGGTLSSDGPTLDPCFEARNGYEQQYSDGSSVRLLVAHNGGAITATGLHSRTDDLIPWESLEFTGSVVSRDGEAQGLLTIHFSLDTEFPSDELDHVSLFLRGTGGCAARTQLEFSFDYIDGRGRTWSESYSLTRVP